MTERSRIHKPGPIALALLIAMGPVWAFAACACGIDGAGTCCEPEPVVVNDSCCATEKPPAADTRCHMDAADTCTCQVQSTPVTPAIPGVTDPIAVPQVDRMPVIPAYTCAIANPADSAVPHATTAPSSPRPMAIPAYLSHQAFRI